MADPKNRPTITLQDLMVSTLAMTDALSKFLIEKGGDRGGGVQEKVRRGKGDVSGDSEIYRAVTMQPVLQTRCIGREEPP
jgi:hypothetical protein